MFTERKNPPTPTRLVPTPSPDGVKPAAITLLTVVGEQARIEGKFDITDSIQIECEVGGELNVGGKLVIGEKGVVSANVQTVDAIIMGQYEGNMVATGNVEIAETGRVTGNIQTDSLVIAKGGFFNGNISKMNQDAGRKVVAIEEKWTGPSQYSEPQRRHNGGRDNRDGRDSRDNRDRDRDNRNMPSPSPLSDESSSSRVIS